MFLIKQHLFSFPNNNSINFPVANQKYCTTQLTESKQKYQTFLKDHFVPIFYKPWYLDAVSDSTWDVVIYSDNGKVLGVWVYMIKKKFGLTYILHPQLCPYMGPLFFDTTDVKKVYDAMIAKLPKHHLIIQDFHFSSSVIEFSEGLSSNKYTYIISNDDNLDILESKMSSNRRRRIRKAGREFTYEEVDDIGEFQDFLDESFTNRGIRNPYSGVKMKDLDDALVKRNARKIIKSTDAHGKILAMQYLLIDEEWVYNLANGVRTDYRHDALSYILWTEIKLANESNKSFDFEGSVIPGVEAFFKLFNGTKTSYHSMYKSKNAIVDLLVRLKNPQLLGK